MQFEWDEDKRQRNIEKHDLDFLLARLVFDGWPIVIGRSAYADEKRWLITGFIEGRYYTVIWTKHGEKIRINSARRRRDAEKRAYRELHPRGT